MVVVPDQPRKTVPCAIWDPDRPLENQSRFSSLSKPMRFDLCAGDKLYLPALWYVSCPVEISWPLFILIRYHKVSQSCSNEGICCAVNYWYASAHPRRSVRLAHVHSVGTIWNSEDPYIP